MHRTGLRLRITVLVIAYMVLLSLAVVWQGNAVNERAEKLVWHSLLQLELDHALARRAADPAWRREDRNDLTLYGAQGGAAMPPALAREHPGVHEIRLHGRRHVALVEDVPAGRVALALDITGFEEQEQRLTVLMVGSALGGLALCGLLIVWGLGRLVQPLIAMVDDITRLRPDRKGVRVPVDPRASREMVVICDALNDYLARNERFVERERAFIDSASHELRTPVAVIAGASALALEHPDTPAAVHGQLARIRRTARGVEQLISLLLVLAKDPERLARSSDRFRLDQLLPEIVEDHRHLCADKDLTLRLEATASCEIVAPLTIVQSAIGNLLRNAIENSDRGEIVVTLRADALVAIDDPGHGMSPEEISAIYARMARREDTQSAAAANAGVVHDARTAGGSSTIGIGLDLIARLCEHLGWTLRIAPRQPRGTHVTLDLGSSRVEENSV